jgi:outer membrane lipoprotein-sorting protein
MDFEDPPEDEIVADGTFLWLFYPSTNPRQVIRSRLGAEGTSSGTADVLARILEEARTNYEGSYVGSEAVDGVATHVVSLRPTTRSQYRLVRVWIAAQDFLVRKFEITEENETVRTVTLSALEPGAALADSLFRFVPPADADVFEG